MITSLLLMTEMALIALLVWRLGRRLNPGETRTLGLLAYTEERYEGAKGKGQPGA